MADYCELYVSDYPVYYGKWAVDPIIMTIFREADRLVFERKMGERNQLSYDYAEDDELRDEIEVAYQYVNTVANVKQRLEVLGFTLGKVRPEFDAIKNNTIEDLEEFTMFPDKLDMLKSKSFDDFLAAFKYLLDNKLTSQNELSAEESPLIRYILEADDDPPFNFPCADFRSFLRAFIEVCPEDSLVILDITDLVHAGCYDPEDLVCEMALEEISENYLINEKIIILTEGSTDKKVLERSMKLFYPHLFEYYSFMDFDTSNAPGSTSSLAATINSICWFRCWEPHYSTFRQ